MSTNLTGLTTAVLSLVGRPATDTLITSAAVTLALNDAANIFAAEYPWPWLTTSENISTTTGTDTYVTAAATTYIDTISVRIAGSPPLERMSKADLDRQFPSTASGQPVAFATHLISSIVVRPVPITTVLPTLVHVYHKAETALSGGSDVLLCPVWYEQAVTQRAAAEMMFRAGNSQMGNIFLGRYDDVVNRALEQVRRTQAQSSGNDTMPAQPLPPLRGKPAAERANA